MERAYIADFIGRKSRHKDVRYAKNLVQQHKGNVFARFINREETCKKAGGFSCTGKQEENNRCKLQEKKDKTNHYQSEQGQLIRIFPFKTDVICCCCKNRAHSKAVYISA